MLGSNERLRTIDGRRVNQIPNELSSSQTSIGSVGGDIQQHLQSMFYLLRPEETLKMVGTFHSYQRVLKTRFKKKNVRKKLLLLCCIISRDSNPQPNNLSCKVLDSLLFLF